jgi:hypothetical protein
VSRQGVGFHVSQNCQQVMIVLNRKGLVPPLIEMTRSPELVKAMMSPNMRIHAPAHECRNLTPLVRQKDDVEVVRHQSEPEDRQRHFLDPIR